MFQPAINELKIRLDVLETNAPINEREGNHEQAKLEYDTAASIRKAIYFLEENDQQP